MRKKVRALLRDMYANHSSTCLELLFFFRNETSLVNLKLQKKGKEVSNVVYGREYSLMADVTHPDGKQNAPLHLFQINSMLGDVL